MDVFEEHRPLLEGIAYRMCGVHADARDLVQETHIQWCAADRAAIRDPRAWLVTTCSRLAIDMLRSAHRRRVSYVGTWLPEPLVDEAAPTPAEALEIDESVSLALMVALERLSPAERAVFILHDLFGYRFEEIGPMVSRSEPACRKLASRARRAVQSERPRFEATAEMHRDLHAAFLEAARHGDLDGLASLLTESVALHTDGGGHVEALTSVLRGRRAVSKFFIGIWRTHFTPADDVEVVHRWFNGSPGTLVFKDGALVVSLDFAIEDGSIQSIYALRNPEKLTAFGYS